MEEHNAAIVAASRRGARLRGGRAAGFSLVVAGAGSNQIGAALGALAVPSIGLTGVVAVRQIITAAVLVPLVRPRIRRLGREQWVLVVGLAIVFSVMNLALYSSISRIGLGLAVTLEFLGPLAVALACSRRPLDAMCAVLAGLGVVLLTSPGPSTDVLGIVLALVAAVAWAAYILLNRAVGRTMPGLEGTATAGLVTALAWSPVAVGWFMFHRPTVGAIVLAVLCGLLSSVVPYVVDLLALRRISTQAFGTLTSANPVFAAFVGWVLLGQWLSVSEWLGVLIIAASNVLVALRKPRRWLADDTQVSSARRMSRPA